MKRTRGVFFTKTSNVTVLWSVCIIMLCVFNGCRENDKTGPEEDVFNVIISRIQQENERTAGSNLDDRVKSHLNTYNGSGFFSDIDYEKTSYTVWEPLAHIDRIRDFAFAYTRPGGSYYQDAALYDAIAAGLQYWYDRNPGSDNWWYNQIAEPQRLGVILIQMRKGEKQLPASVESDALERMQTDGGNAADQSGANKADIALHWLYRAVLTRDASLLELAVSEVYAPLELVSTEGIQHDYSYFQHGRQFYTGGYGEVLISNITLIAMYTAGTPFALAGEKLDILSRFVRESYLGVIRGQYMLFSVSGRGGLSRQNQLFKPGSAGFISRMQSIDPDYADVYVGAVKRLRGEVPADYGVAPKNTHYFIGDYFLHTRPDYVFDVRMTSTRTSRIEYGNGENLKTYYASDGSTNILLQGNEYDSIFGVWNWTRVPGITCPQSPSIPLPPNVWAVYGTSEFAGGVSDSLYGAAAYSYNASYTGNSAKKAWFFFDDEVVCLGSDITSASAYDINTTVNQCLLSGDVIVSVQGVSSVLARGEWEYQITPDWVLHNGVGYCFPQKGTVAISNKAQTGNWRDINRDHTDKTESKDVFILWFNHGKNVAAGKYAYIVVPGKNSVDEMNQYQKSSVVEIIANTEKVQAVRHGGLDILEIIFHEAGEVEHNGISIQVDKPCAILLRNVTSPTVTMHVSDPARREAQITITGRFPAFSGDEKSVVCDFRNTGVYAGASKVYTIGAD